jgi:hypothetical protein
MDRYIDVDKAKEVFHHKTGGSSFDSFIDDVPTADVEEVVHGEWIVTKAEFGWNCVEYPAEYTCSVCGRKEKQEEPYCHCGAKMDGRK